MIKEGLSSINRQEKDMFSSLNVNENNKPKSRLILVSKYFLPVLDKFKGETEIDIELHDGIKNYNKEDKKQLVGEIIKRCVNGNNAKKAASEILTEIGSRIHPLQIELKEAEDAEQKESSEIIQEEINELRDYCSDIITSVDYERKIFEDELEWRKSCAEQYAKEMEYQQKKDQMNHNIASIRTIMDNAELSIEERIIESDKISTETNRLSGEIKVLASKKIMNHFPASYAIYKDTLNKQ